MYKKIVEKRIYRQKLDVPEGKDEGVAGQVEDKGSDFESQETRQLLLQRIKCC